MDVLSSLVPWLIGYGFIAQLVVGREQRKTKTADSDPTYLGFLVFVQLPFIMAFVIVFLTSVGLWEILFAVAALWIIRDAIRYSLQYIAARWLQKRQAKDKVDSK